MPLVYVGIGSNIGDRKKNFEFAAHELLKDGRVRDLHRSSVYETEPVGGEGGQDSYWNAVWSFVTELTPPALLERLHEIEEAAGRKRVKVNEARVLDLDILFYGARLFRKSTYTIPHPRLHQRAFVLVPFCDLAPGFTHPGLRKTMTQLLEEYRILHDGIRGVVKLAGDVCS
jgi:2-amino-4-hydroxy-6-hydroxymethyldihydropteridine diphosphokinase